MVKKIFSFFVLITIVLLFSFTVSCKITYVIPEEINEADTVMEDADEEAALEEIPEEVYEENAVEEKEPAEGTRGENAGETAEEPVEEISEGQEGDEKTTEEYFLNILISFLEAVKTDTEYMYFSSATAAIVGTEEEYKNGTKSDYYFIIKESHSHWENIEIETVDINGDAADIGIIGDRMAEGMLYEDDKVTFKFVKENGEWKIDFS